MTLETDDPDFRLLGERVVAAMQRLGIPGAAVGVVHGDRVLAAGFGVTNVEHPDGGGLLVRRVPKAPADASSPDTAPPPERFVFCARDRVAPAADPGLVQLDFGRDAGGRIAWFRYGRQLYPRQAPR